MPGMRPTGGLRGPAMRASGASAGGRAGGGGGRGRGGGRGAGGPAGERGGRSVGSVATVGVRNRPGRAEGLLGKRPGPQPGRCPPGGGQTGRGSCSVAGTREGGVGLSCLGFARPAPVTAAGVRGQWPKWAEHSPFSPLLLRREYPMCPPTRSPGSGLRNPPPATQCCFVPLSVIYTGPRKTVPIATWAPA